MRITNDNIYRLAQTLRPLITPFLECSGQVTNDELIGIITDLRKKGQVVPMVKSEVTLNRIQAALCDL